VARIEASTHIEVAPARVWEVLTDWESQPQWMQDAHSVTVRTTQREGVGVALRCKMNVAAGLFVADDMVTTDWDDGRLIAIRHTGRLIHGVGAFELRPTPWGTRLVWWEEVEAPFSAVGEAVAELAVVPVIRRRFRSSLAALKRLCESPGATPGATEAPE
jgi:uncharacterized protein YndB with AHSA1/START domain